MNEVTQNFNLALYTLADCFIKPGAAASLDVYVSSIQVHGCKCDGKSESVWESVYSPCKVIYTCKLAVSWSSIIRQVRRCDDVRRCDGVDFLTSCCKWTY